MGKWEGKEGRREEGGEGGVGHCKQSQVPLQFSEFADLFLEILINCLPVKCPIWG